MELSSATVRNDDHSELSAIRAFENALGDVGWQASSTDRGHPHDLVIKAPGRQHLLREPQVLRGRVPGSGGLIGVIGAKHGRISPSIRRLSRKTPTLHTKS